MAEWRLVIDIETTGIPKLKNYRNYHPYVDTDKYDRSRIVSISWSLFRSNHPDETIEYNYIIKPQGFVIMNTHIHGVEHIYAEKHGVTIKHALESLEQVIDERLVGTIICHNVEFDTNIIASEAYRIGLKTLAHKIINTPTYCTMEQSRNIVQISPFRRGQWKLPTLQQLHLALFKHQFEGAHNSMEDVRATHRCYVKLTT